MRLHPLRLLPKKQIVFFAFSDRQDYFEADIFIKRSFEKSVTSKCQFFLTFSISMSFYNNNVVKNQIEQHHEQRIKSKIIVFVIKSPHFGWCHC